MARGGEPTEATRPYQFGDEFNVDLRRTVQSAVMRSGKSVPVRLEADDFQVRETEDMAQASTVLMIDLSLSMAMRGNFVTAKKVALALDTLIRTQFSRDSLYVVGFSTYAREMKPETLAYLSWDEFEPYTNIQHGLVVAQKLLARHAGGNKQIIMVSDGEPTAHIENGRIFLQYPPSPRTIQETLKEVVANHAGGHLHQHVHAGAELVPDGLCGSDNENQQGPRLLHVAGAAWRIHRGGLLHQPPPLHHLVTGPVSYGSGENDSGAASECDS